jgi:putative Holliday junction resolvase
VNSKPVIGLDVGDKRVGVALAGPVARLANPLTTLDRGDGLMDAIIGLIAEHDAGSLVVGLPRNLDGEDTKQTAITREFIAELERAVSVPVYLSDEALTSQKAEAVLRSRSKPYSKADIDALAAALILDDHLQKTGAPQ